MQTHPPWAKLKDSGFKERAGGLYINSGVSAKLAGGEGETAETLSRIIF